MVSTDFYIEFVLDDFPEEDVLRAEAERRLRALAEERDDMVGANVAVERVESSETPRVYRARVVAFVRPDNIAATDKSDSAIGALKGALRAIERQVRDKRQKLGRPWERPDV